MSWIHEPQDLLDRNLRVRVPIQPFPWPTTGFATPAEPNPHACPQCGGKDFEKSLSKSGDWGCNDCGNEWNEGARLAEEQRKRVEAQAAKFARLRQQQQERGVPRSSKE